MPDEPRRTCQHRRVPRFSFASRSNGVPLLLGMLAGLMLSSPAAAQTPSEGAIEGAPHDEAAHDEAAHGEAAHDEAAHDEAADDEVAERFASSIGSIDEAMHAEQRDAGLWGLGIWTAIGLVTALVLARSRRLGR